MGVARWLRVAWRGRGAPPFADLAPAVEWQVNGRCNYDCSYCIQSRARRVGEPDEVTVGRIVAGLRRLPGEWEIKMSGGEPFAGRGFLHWAVPGVVAETPHALSVLTNFSAPLDVLERFCRLAGARLRITSASFHPEYVALAEFADKARRYRDLRARFNPRSSFVVNSVVLPGGLAAQFEVKRRLEAEGFRYFPQLLKVKGGVYPYGEDDRRLIEQLTGGSRDPRAVNRAPSYAGRHCEAGSWYFVVDQAGEAYRCRTGKRFLAEDGSAGLGNLARGTFRRRRRGAPCPYPICPCTVPANRGIVRLTAGG